MLLGTAALGFFLQKETKATKGGLELELRDCVEIG